MPLEIVTSGRTTVTQPPGRPGRGARCRAPGRSPSSPPTAGPGCRHRPRSSGRTGRPRGRTTGWVCRPARPRAPALARSRPPTRRGARPHERGDVADVHPVDGAVRAEGEDVTGEHVDPPQASPRRRPDRPLAVVAEGIGDLLERALTMRPRAESTISPTTRRRSDAPRASVGPSTSQSACAAGPPLDSVSASTVIASTSSGSRVVMTATPLA